MKPVTSWVLAFLTLGAFMAYGYIFPNDDVALGGETILNAKVEAINKVKDDFTKEGAYRQYQKGEIDPNAYVHEYKSDAGVGYQIFEEETRADGLYRRSYGEGTEAEARSFDWKLVEPIATST